MASLHVPLTLSSWFPTLVGMFPISISLGIPFSSKQGHHFSLRAPWWLWRILFTSKWQFCSHINSLELRMIVQSVQWRSRHLSSFSSRWLHLADSMVCNYILSKGRTSSRMLQPLVKRRSAFVLALNIVTNFMVMSTRPKTRLTRQADRKSFAGRTTAERISLRDSGITFRTRQRTLLLPLLEGLTSLLDLDSTCEDWSLGTSLGIIGDALCGLQFYWPEVKGQRSSWRLYKNWRRLEVPTQPHQSQH